ncbi:MAG: putative Dihydroorotate dehydrogenase [Candidatus Kaiserbacteria bacterium]|nr:putative Dihydroorotate dehydrogenase [Candidatus Kaiserbacteria bacterium]
MNTFSTPDKALEYIQSLSWGNAAGTCKNLKTAERFARTGMRVVTYGSYTMEPREGNTGNNFFYDEKTGNSINALGIPNQGHEATLPLLRKICQSVNDAGANFCVSISAGNKFDPEEYHYMAADIASYNAANIVEGNFSCGNMVVDGKFKPIVCFDSDAFREGVASLKNGAGGLLTAIKHAPITEARFLIPNIKACVDIGIDYVILANTIPNSYLEKELGKPAINMGRGGLGGKALIPIVSGMLMQAREIVKGTKTKLIAAGGIDSGLDAYKYLCLGAHGFQFNTALSRRNLDPKVAQEIIMGDKSVGHTGLVDYLVEYGLPD